MGAERLSDKTVKRHLSPLSQVLQFAVDEGHLTVAQRAEMVEGHRFREERGAREQRGAFAPPEVATIFGSPLYRGCHTFFRSKPGPEIVRDSKFWLPLLLAFEGARLGELADLRRCDVRCDETAGGTWAIDLNENARRLKNFNAVRVVPIHPVISGSAFSPTSPVWRRVRPTRSFRTSNRRGRTASAVRASPAGSSTTCARSA